jgi:hypothetical protein
MARPAKAESSTHRETTITATVLDSTLKINGFDNCLLSVSMPVFRGISTTTLWERIDGNKVKTLA